MKTPADNQAVIEAHALTWLARRDGGMDTEELAEFQRWCSADPRHADAVARITAAWTTLDQPRRNGQAELLRAELRGLNRRRWQRRGFAATSLLATVCVAVALWMKPPAGPTPQAMPAVAANTARVDSPEHRTLPDGSKVDLDTGSSLEVAFEPGLRRVRLLRGQAHFDVAKDANRPFVVSVGALEVRAVGTAFAVQLAAEKVEVVVTEGRVAVATGRTDPSPIEAPAEPVEPALSVPPDAALDAVPGVLVAAGNRVVVPVTAALPVTAVPVTPAEIEERLAWRQPRLEFTDTTLAEATALFNARNRRQLRIDDAKVAALRITGVFRADNVDGFVALVASSFDLQADRPEGTADVVLLGHAVPATSR